MLRPATEADVSRIAEILVFAKRTAYRPIFQNDDFSFNELQVVPLAQELLTGHALDEYRVYDDGIVRGVMQISYVPDEAYPESARLLTFYVDPFFQGMGYGGKMMRSFLSEARRRGASCIVLWALEKNARARAIYEHFGFEHDGERTYEPETPEFLFRYVKKL